MTGPVGWRRIAKMLVARDLSQEIARDLSQEIARDLSLRFFVDPFCFESGDVLLHFRHVVGVYPRGELDEACIPHSFPLFVLPKRVLALGLVERCVTVSHDLLRACMSLCSCSAFESAFSTSHTSCALWRVQNRAVAAPSCLSDHAPWLSLPMVQVDVLLSMACFFQCAVSAGGFWLREFAWRAEQVAISLREFVNDRLFSARRGMCIQRNLLFQVYLFCIVVRHLQHHWVKVCNSRNQAFQPNRKVLRCASLFGKCSRCDPLFKFVSYVECERCFSGVHGYTLGCWLIVAVAKQIRASMYECFLGPFFLQSMQVAQEHRSFSVLTCRNRWVHLAFIVRAPLLLGSVLWSLTTNTFSHKYLGVSTQGYVCST
jgi:hypothetical protein